MNTTIQQSSMQSHASTGTHKKNTCTNTQRPTVSIDAADPRGPTRPPGYRPRSRTDSDTDADTDADPRGNPILHWCGPTSPNSERLRGDTSRLFAVCVGVPHVSARVVPQCARQCGIGASVGPGGIGSLRGIDTGSVRGTGPRVATIWVSVWVAGGLRTILASIRNYRVVGIGKASFYISVAGWKEARCSGIVFLKFLWHARPLREGLRFFMEPASGKKTQRKKYIL